MAALLRKKLMHLSSASTRGGTPGCIGGNMEKIGDFDWDCSPNRGENVVGYFLVLQTLGEIKGLRQFFFIDVTEEDADVMEEYYCPTCLTDFIDWLINSFS